MSIYIVPAVHEIAPIDLFNKKLASWALLPPTLLGELLQKRGIRAFIAVVLAAAISIVMAPAEAARGTHWVAAHRAKRLGRRLAACGLEQHPARTGGLGSRRAGWAGWRAP